MADEILVDLNAVFEMASDLGENLGANEQAPVLQIMATVALCERLDVMNNHLESAVRNLGGIDDTLATIRIQKL